MQINSAMWPTLSRLLDQWLDLPEAEREKWLESLGPEYIEVIPVLRELIQASAGSLSRFHELPHFDSNSGFRTDDVIGPHRLIRELGAGGMGVVWLAERMDGLKRMVAL